MADVGVKYTVHGKKPLGKGGIEEKEVQQEASKWKRQVKI
jgi:hypothetical protein